MTIVTNLGDSNDDFVFFVATTTQSTLPPHIPQIGQGGGINVVESNRKTIAFEITGNFSIC